MNEAFRLSSPKVRLGAPEDSRNSAAGLMLSMPVIIDFSTLSVQLLRGMLSNTKYLPTQYRVAFFTADVLATYALQVWIQHRKSKTDFSSLPMGARVSRIAGRPVRRWKSFWSRQPLETEE